MDVLSPVYILILMAAASISALFVLWVSGLFLSKSAGHATPVQTTPSDAFFLFQDDRLVDMDIGADRSADEAIEDWQSWNDLRTAIGAQFPDLPNALADLPEDLEVRFPAIGTTKGACLVCHRQGITARLRLTVAVAPTAWDILTQATAHHGQHNQIKALRDAPNAVCLSDRDGNVTWHNPEWVSLPCVVAEAAMEDSGVDAAGDVPARRIADPDTGRVFELRVAEHDSGRSLYVSEVTGLVQAENAQRKFVQTLTKTFANLTTGLAVFDRNQELALFNPALLDLTALPAPFLTARPHVMSFFDKLRDRQVMPEPRNYAKWRKHILDMIESASGGLYQENWALPSGLTYRITGRPHPDGAVAFLIEDITDEMSIKRRFRAQLDLRQLVLDEMDEAITVFNARHLLMFCNQRCADLLGIDPDSSFADFSVADIIKAYTDTPLGQADWCEVEAQLVSDKGGMNKKWLLRGATGQVTECRVRSLSGGTKMLQVRPMTTSTAPSKAPMRA